MADRARGLAPLQVTQVMQVTVVVCVAPRETQEQVLQLPVGSTVGDALDALGSLAAIGGDTLQSKNPRHSDAVPPSVLVGVWGRVVDRNVLLGHLDRLEIYRPLTVDPKVARRERFARQGARTTGLFANRRDGGKSGY
ncbi:RnfH family protein [Acidovorax radicis]|uniref:RnfH family protein n=1 Tax=Acidovorax radicis TaxID=758826 RepID=UPI001CFC3478|nr:RnfH family protein [Acidovorax radicis]